MGASPQHVTLTANTVTTITLDINYGTVEILNRDGAAEIYISVDGTNPTVGADGYHVLPAAIGSIELRDRTDGPTVVKLVSAGTPKASVRGL